MKWRVALPGQCSAFRRDRRGGIAALVVALVIAGVAAPVALATWTTVYYVGSASTAEWVPAASDQVDDGWSNNGGLAWTAYLCASTSTCGTNYDTLWSFWLVKQDGNYVCYQWHMSGYGSCYVNPNYYYTRAHCNNNKWTGTYAICNKLKWV